jgi:hypothetical protein
MTHDPVIVVQAFNITYSEDGFVNLHWELALYQIKKDEAYKKPIYFIT